MKIAMVHSFYRSGPSGENSAVHMQAKALAEVGHDVRIIARSTDRYINRPGYAIASGLTVATGLGPSPSNEINKFDPDIIHVHNLFPNWGDRWLKKLDQPIVATLHNFRSICSAGTMSLEGAPCELCPTKGSHHAVKNRCYQDSVIKSVPLAIATRDSSSNRIFRDTAEIVFLSEEAKREFEKFIPGTVVPRKSVIPNFSSPVAPTTGKSKSTNQEGYWFFAGRLSAEKGIIPLLRAWPARSRLVVAGSGPLSSEAEQLSQDKNVTLLGEVSREEVSLRMQESVGLVFPSVCMEMSPLTLIEALGHGLPVVAKSGNAAAELIQQYDAGRVFDDFQGLPEAIKHVESASSAFRAKARILYSDRFTKARWLEKMLEVYERVLEA